MPILMLGLVACSRADRHAAEPHRAPVAVPLPAVIDAGPMTACLPVASCGCFRGACAAVEPVGTIRGRVHGGPLDGHSVIIVHSCPGDDRFSQITRCLDWIEEADVCTGACAPADPGYSCGVVAGACQKL